MHLNEQMQKSWPSGVIPGVDGKVNQILGSLGGVVLDGDV